MNDEMEDVALTVEELALARRWAKSQIGRPSTRTDTQPLSQRKATVLIYRLLATIDRHERGKKRCACSKWAEQTYGLRGPCPWHDVPLHT